MKAALRSILHQSSVFFTFLAFGLISFKEIKSQNIFPSTGNAGIGTTSAIHPIHIVCGDYSGGFGNATSNLSGAYPNNGVLIEKTSGPFAASLYLQYSANGLNRRWAMSSAGTGNINPGSFVISDMNAAADRLTINSNGNLGIGISHPTERIHSVGGVRFEGITNGGSPNDVLAIDASGKLWRYPINAGGGITNLCTFGNYNYVLKYSNTNEVNCSQIYDDGFGVGIGTNSPTDMLTVNGNVRSLSNTFLSDSRFKIGAAPLTNVLQSLTRINIYSYRFKETKGYNFDKSLHYGVFAQELKRVYPDLVKEGKDKTLSVNYIELIPMVIQGVKEQNEEIKQLKAEIESLKELIRNKNTPASPAKWFSISPNPVHHNSLMITTYSKNIQGEFVITSSNGTVLKRSNSLNIINNHVLNLNNLQHGSYFLTLIAPGGEVLQTEKFIKL
jgi:trimeric autotransporter adhesin